MFNIKITGVAEIQKLLAAMPDRLRGNLDQQTRIMGYKILQDAKANLPRSDKQKVHLQDALKLKVMKVSDMKTIVLVRNEHELWIEAMALEFGTRFMSARPFLRPALEKNRDDTFQIIAQSLQRVIE